MTYISHKCGLGNYGLENPFILEKKNIFFPLVCSGYLKSKTLLGLKNLHKCTVDNHEYILVQ